MMNKILKYLMGCHKPRILAFIVALLHLVMTIRTIYIITIYFLCYYNDKDNQHVSKDDIFDMPITVVRYMIIMYVLIVIVSVLLLIGLTVKSAICIASFMLTMGIFVVTYGLFAVCDILEGLLDDASFSEILLEFMNDTTVLVVDILLMYPVFLVFVDVTEPLDVSECQDNFNKNKSSSNVNCAESNVV